MAALPIRLRLIGLDKVLEVSPSATQQQIRDAYKKYDPHVGNRMTSL